MSLIPIYCISFIDFIMKILFSWSDQEQPSRCIQQPHHFCAIGHQKCLLVLATCYPSLAQYGNKCLPSLIVQHNHDKIETVMITVVELNGQ